MKTSKTLLTITILGLLANTASAALIQHFRLEEGALDPATNNVFSASSSNTGTLTSGISSLPVWVTTNLPSVPSPGTVAAVFFDGTQTTKSSIYTDYNGSDGGVITGNVARTVCAWIKAKASQPPAGGSHIVNWGGGAAGGITGGRYTIKLQPNSAGVDAGKLRLEVQGGGINGTKDLRDGKWHHIAVLNTNGSTVGNARLFVDGAIEPITTSSGTGTLINTVVNTDGVDWVRIGGGNWDPLRGFNGAIDDVQLYDTALTLGEIQAIVFGGTNPPSLNSSLASQSIILGGTDANVTFSVAAGGTPPLACQWKFYGTNLPGETNFSLVISNAGPANAGPYSVTITNVFGATNASANLTLATAPIDPPQQAALIGGKAAFSVAMPTTSSGYTYQWRKDDADLSGATASGYSIASVALADESQNYTVVVTLGGNSATSAPAKLKVLAAPSSAYATRVLSDGPAAYWRLGENNGATVAVDQTTFNHGAYNAYTGVELGLTGAITNDANTASAFSSVTSNYIQVPYSPELNRSNAVTLEAWANLTSTFFKQTIISSQGELPNAGYELFLSGTESWVFRTSTNLNSTGLFWNDLVVPATTVGSWTHLAATFDGETKRLYVNGTLMDTQTTGLRTVLGTPLRLGCGNPSAAPNEFVDGTLDEIAIYRRALSSADVAAHYLLATGKQLRVELNPSGADLVISWPVGFLQEADDLAGPWTTLTGITSPYQVTPSSPSKFYRISLEP